MKIISPCKDELAFRENSYKMYPPEHRSASPKSGGPPNLQTRYCRFGLDSSSSISGWEVERPSVFEIAKRFLLYGFTAVGGPPAHLATFQTQLVGDDEVRHWVTNEKFAEMIALASSLPGPTSTQVAFGLGITQQGVIGGLTSGICFLLPGFFLMSSIGLLAGNAAEEISRKGSMFEKNKFIRQLLYNFRISFKFMFIKSFTFVNLS